VIPCRLAGAYPSSQKASTSNWAAPLPAMRATGSIRSCLGSAAVSVGRSMVVMVFYALIGYRVSLHHKQDPAGKAGYNHARGKKRGKKESKLRSNDIAAGARSLTGRTKSMSLVLDFFRPPESTSMFRWRNGSEAQVSCVIVASVFTFASTGKADSVSRSGAKFGGMFQTHSPLAVIQGLLGMF